MEEKTYKLYSSLPEMENRKTWAEVDLGALAENYRLLRDAVTSDGETPPRMIAVVKAEAYGHGTPEVVRTLLREGCDFYAVSCIDEAISVRNVCDAEGKEAEILILGYTQPDLAPLLTRYDLIQALLSEKFARELDAEAKKTGVKIRAHVALDTGMNRIGFAAHGEEEISDSVERIAQLQALSQIRLEGLFSHFARADEKEGLARTDLQAARFRDVKKRLEEKGISIPFCHVCNSVASITRPQDFMDGVRVGILLYGARPCAGIDLPLRPVMKLRTVISHLHAVLPGEEVGYGGTFRPEEERLVATLPIGYADGFLRAYSGAFVTVSTEKGDFPAQIVGRICMDQCMVDVTGLDAREGDVVTLFGNDPKELSALSARAGTIDYESLCILSPRVTRIYKD